MRNDHFRIGIASIILVAYGTAVAQERDWQQSTDTQTQLWVRDKNQGQPYQAAFMMVEPNGKSVALTVHSGNGGVASATFPKDFGVFPPLPSGKYHWTAIVSGSVVASDDFNR